MILDENLFQDYRKPLKESKSKSINEAAPSKLTKTKDTSRKVTNSYFAGDVYDTHSSMYDKEDTYYGNRSEGYIMDKSGNKYDLVASISTEDSGRIAKGTTNYYVNINYEGKKLTFSGYSAIFGSSKNAGMISDLQDGIFLEDFCARFSYSGPEEDIVKELASRGDKDAASYKSIQTDKAKARFEKRYISIPLKKDIKIRVSGGSLSFSEDNESSISPYLDDLKSLLDKVKHVLDKYVLVNGYTLNDLSGSVIYLNKPSGATILYDSRNHSLVHDVSSFSSEKHSMEELGVSFRTEETYDYRSWLRKHYYNSFNEPIYQKFNMYAIDVKGSPLFKELSKIAARLRKSSRADWVSTRVDYTLRDGAPYGGYARGEKGPAKASARADAQEIFDDATKTILAGTLPTQILISCLEDMPKKEVIEISNELSNDSSNNSQVPQKRSKSYPSAYYEKMNAWHEGRRKQNVKACSDDKLLAYYDICRELGFEEQQKILYDEITARHLELSESIHVNESKFINEDIDGTLNKLGGPAAFRRELMATIDAYPGIEDDIEELADMMYGGYEDVISIEELESAIEYMIDDALESTEAANSSYSPELLNDLVNYYRSLDTMSYEEIWDEIVVKYNNKNLANDVIESLDNDEEDFEDEFLDESLSSLSEDQLDKSMELIDEIYEACKSIYSYNENGKFEEGLNLNEWSIYTAAIDLHDLIEHKSIKESLEEDDNTCSFYEGDQLEWVSLSGVKYRAVVAETSEDYITLDFMSLGGKPERKSFELTVDPEGRECIIVDIAPNKRNAVYVYPECDDENHFEENLRNRHKAVNESTETDETPWSYKEVEDALKNLSNNWRDNSGVCRCWYKEEKQHAVKILRKHYKVVETSQDGDWTVIAFETPIQKESMLEDYLRESNYEESAAKLSDRSLDDMIDLMTDMATDGDNKYSDHLNALKAEKAKREKKAEYKNSRRAKRDELGIEGKYPYYVTLYHEYPIYEPAEGGYYYAGLQAHSAEGYNSFKEAAAAIGQVAKELVDSGYNFVKKSAGEYEDYGDKYIGTGSILCIEDNKHFRSREQGYQPYE